MCIRDRFNYSAAAYCADATDPTPTITGLGGGTFSSTAGLTIDATTGVIDVSASTPGTYTVTYATAGTCPNSSTVSVTVNALDDASFSYASTSYCISGTDPSATVTGLAGGTFTSTPGLVINATTGQIDVSASTIGMYTVTYTTNGTCPNTATASITILSADDAAFTMTPTCDGGAASVPGTTGGSILVGRSTCRRDHRSNYRSSFWRNFWSDLYCSVRNIRCVCSKYNGKLYGTYQPGN